MLKKIRKHRRASVLISCMGILLAGSCMARISEAKEITFEKVFSEDAMVEYNPQASSSSPVSLPKSAPEVAAPVPLDTAVRGVIQNASQNNFQEIAEEPVAGQSSPSYAGSGADSFVSQDLVLAVYAKKKKLSSGIFAVQHNGQYYLPFATLSDVIGFYYDIDTSAEFVEGWALSEEDDYSIDVKNRVLRFRGEKFDLPSEAVLESGIVDDDIYVLIDVLSQIWPLQMDVNLSSLTLKIVPDSKLPFELAFNRKLQRERAMLEKEARLKEENFPFVPYPYQLYSKPTVDLSALLGYEEVSNKSIARVSLNGVNDLAYASADYSVTASQTGGEFQRPENIRFRLRRQNIHEGALPFGLEDTQLGDVRLRNRDLISSNAGGRGFVFSTEKTKKVGEFDLVTIDGLGTPGWEVELYLNNELINFSEVDDGGEYRFEDISVGFGNNRFRIVLYGPQGQIKERVENYIYQSSMVKKGENTFSGGIVDANKDLIPLEERRRGRASGLTANVYAARGLAEQLTGFVTANTVRDREDGEEVSREYVSAGAIGSVGSTLAQAEIYKQLDGGSAVDVRTLSNFLGFKVNSRVSAFQDFDSPDAQSGANAKNLETEIGVKRIFKTALGSLGLEGKHSYLKREAGPDSSRYITRQSLGIKGVRMTNNTTSNLTDGDHQSTSGRFSVSTRKDNWNLRNSLNYSLHPNTEVTSIQSELRYGRQREYTTGLRAGYNFLSDEARLGAQISKDFKKFLGSAETEWSSRHGVGFSLRASTALGPFGKDGAYNYKSTPLTNTGAVGSFVYADKNYNGVYDADDEPVEGAKVIFNRRVTRHETEEDGHLMELLSAQLGKTNMKVATESLEDPYFIPTVEGYNIHPRAGVVHQLEFPLIETGAIDGTLRWNAEGKPIPGVNLQLLNEEADIIQSTKTAVDGYFTFERIPPGNYTIRPDPEDGLDIPFKYVNLTPDNLFQFGTDILGTSDGAVQNVDLGIEVGKDGALNVKNILSLAKGYKDKKRAKVHKASASNAGGQARVIKSSLGHSQKSAVQKIRIGDHPNKVRVVMDLSAPLDYSISFEPKSNTVFVEMPYAMWSAQNSWDSQNGAILSGYRVEKLAQGVRLILNVQNGVDIGASGLLKANGGKKDRLYIDIEKR